MKTASRTLLALYLVTLLWLVLFKTSFDLFGVLLDHQTRSLNLIPFADSESLREIVDNLVFFIPFGLLLGVVFKQVEIRRKVVAILAFSCTVEITQFVLAIGRTDITDVITNTCGGLIGLALYHLGSKHLNDRKLDWFIIVGGGILLVAFLLFRVLILKIKY